MSFINHINKRNNYYLVNTNRKSDPDRQDEETMLREQIVSLYFTGHKELIQKLKNNDVVFLYATKVGIIACGTVDGQPLRRDYRGNPQFLDSEFYQKFKTFYRPTSPISINKILEICGKRPNFRRSLVPIPDLQGRLLFDELATLCTDSEKTKAS